jgi:poly(A) polymerase
MPIITPCYPPMNSSYNVGEPQLRRMRDELLRASKLCDNIVNNHASSSCSCWDVLIENDFFKQHANYLQVCVFNMDGPVSSSHD